jgi:uncharacterized RDD family membrane protein YckC
MDIMPFDPAQPEAPPSYVDQLTIETPEQTSLDFTVAGIGSRFLALALDTLIQFAAGVVVGIAGTFGLAATAAVAPKLALWTGAILIVFYFLLYFGYYALFEIIWNGQTIGKRVVGIRVVKDSGRPLTPAESIGRNLMRIVDWLPFLYAIGIVSAVLTKENKRLGDLVAGSLVVREASLASLKPVWQTEQPAAPPVASFYGGANLTAQEFALIDSFLTRRSELDYDIRLRMADQIFYRLKPKLTLPPDNSLSTEGILEAVAYERRSAGSYGA